MQTFLIIFSKVKALKMRQVQVCEMRCLSWQERVCSLAWPLLTHFVQISQENNCFHCSYENKWNIKNRVGLCVLVMCVSLLAVFGAAVQLWREKFLWDKFVVNMIHAKRTTDRQTICCVMRFITETKVLGGICRHACCSPPLPELLKKLQN